MDNSTVLVTISTELWLQEWATVKRFTPTIMKEHEAPSAPCKQHCVLPKLDAR